MAKSKRRPVRFPGDFNQPDKLADWLELSALFQADGNASAGDLERKLRQLSCANVESLIGSVFTEIDRRVLATTPAAYPFSRADTSISIKGKISDYPAYIFCLAVSFYGWKPYRGAAANPWLLFEEICGFSAKRYIGGESIVFGTSSRSGSKAKNVFQLRVTALSKALGEGDGFRPQKKFSTKDGKLDVVAWRPFPDKRASQIVIFGQCAAGASWIGAKLTELCPDSFWDQWMSTGKVSTLLRSVFVPHRVFDDKEWEFHARSARLLFDRCRVAAHSNQDIKGTPLAVRLLKCCKTEWSIST